MPRRQLATGNMPISDTRSGAINYVIKQPSVRIVVVYAINRYLTGVHTAKKK